MCENNLKQDQNATQCDQIAKATSNKSFKSQCDKIAPNRSKFLPGLFFQNKNLNNVMKVHPIWQRTLENPPQDQNTGATQCDQARGARWFILKPKIPIWVNL
jgi:hypothetical protein